MSGLEGFATGLAKGLDAYLGLRNQADIQMGMQKQRMDYASQIHMQQRQQQDALKPKLTFAQLKTINPGLAKLGLSDDTQINYEHLNDLASVLPKEDAAAAGKFATIPEAKLWLKMGGVPDNKIDTILNTPEATKVGRVPLSLLDDHIKGQSASLLNLKDTVNFLAKSAEGSGEVLPPDKLIADALSLQEELQSLGSGKAFLPTEGIDQATEMALQMLASETKKGTPSKDAMASVFGQIQTAYTPGTSKKVIAKLNERLEASQKANKPRSGIGRLFGR